LAVASENHTVTAAERWRAIRQSSSSRRD